MSTTTRVFNYRHKPLPSGYVWVGRKNKYSGGLFGNPHAHGFACETCFQRYRIPTSHDGPECMALYKAYFFDRLATDDEFRLCVLKLRGKPLVCGCVKKDGSGECHGKVIASFLDSLPSIVTEEELIGAARAELARLAAQAVEEAEADAKR